MSVTPLEMIQIGVILGAAIVVRTLSTTSTGTASQNTATTANNRSTKVARVVTQPSNTKDIGTKFLSIVRVACMTSNTNLVPILIVMARSSTKSFGIVSPTTAPVRATTKSHAKIQNVGRKLILTANGTGLPTTASHV